MIQLCGHKFSIHKISHYLNSTKLLPSVIHSMCDTFDILFMQIRPVKYKLLKMDIKLKRKYI